MSPVAMDSSEQQVWKEDGYEEETDGDDESLDEEMKEIPRQKSGDRLYQAPTSEEMRQLKDTSELFQSNIFKLQEKMLKEVTPKAHPALDSLLLNVKSALMEKSFQCEDLDKATSLDEISSILSSNGSVQIPFPRSTCAAHMENIKFQFKKPKKMFVVGSYLLKTAIKGKDGMTVDVAIEMDETMFQEKDFMNYRYFYKRSYFLAVLARHLAQTMDLVELSFEYIHGDERRPVLMIEQKSEKKPIRIRLLPLLSDQTFGWTKVGPKRNCVRPQSSSNLIPTPNYNASLLMDSAYVGHLNYLHGVSQAAPGFNDSVKLLKVWLHQRGLSSLGFVCSMLIAHLLTSSSGKKCPSSSSSFQLFKSTLDFISKHDFRKDPVFMTASGKAINDEFSIEAFMEVSDIVIVDPTGRLNLAALFSASEFNRLQMESKIAIGYLSKPAEDHFASLFLQNAHRMALMYDLVMSFSTTDCQPLNWQSGTMADYTHVHQYLERQLPQLLQEALGDRVKMVAVHNDDSVNRWSLNREIPQGRNKLWIGVLVDAEKSLRVVEYGPTPSDSGSDEDQASKLKRFKYLWGSKSELRRFKDGSILESVVFVSDGSYEQRSSIVTKMIEFLVQRHAGLHAATPIQCWSGSSFYPFIQLNSLSTIYGKDDKNTSFKPAMDMFDQLSKVLKGLESLPLEIETIHPISPALRYASAFPPVPFNPSSEYILYDEPIDILLQFESSARWPDDIMAIQEMKLAFMLKIAEEMREDYPEYQVVMTDGHSDPGRPSDSVSFNSTIRFKGRSVLVDRFMDILTPAGYLFRCRIHCDREETLIREQIKTLPSFDKPTHLRDASYQLEIYESLFKVAPVHARLVSNSILRNPSLPFSIRLLKRWLASHMLLSTRIPEEIVETLCIAAYTGKNEPWVRPASAWSGFIRALHLLATFDWMNSPLVVSLDVESTTSPFTENQLLSIYEMFQGQRRVRGENDQVGGPAMFVITEADSACKSWMFSQGNTQAVCTKIVQLAKAALKTLEKMLDKNMDGPQSLACLASLFTPSSSFDALIRIRPHTCPRFYQSLRFVKTEAPKQKAGFKNLSQNLGSCFTHLPNRLSHMDHLRLYDPVEKYLETLKKLFGHACEFELDVFGGTCIGIKWKAGAKKTTPFKINLNYSVEPLAVESHTRKKRKGQTSEELEAFTLNTFGTLADMIKLGGDMVLSSEVLK